MAPNYSQHPGSHFYTLVCRRRRAGAIGTKTMAPATQYRHLYVVNASQMGPSRGVSVRGM